MAQPYPLPRQIRRTDVLVGDGVNSTYGPFAFKIFDAEDVTAWLKRPTDEKWRTAVVTVQKVNGAAFDTFTVKFGATLNPEDKFVISGARIPERSAGVTQGTKLDPTALEKELTKQAVTLQEARRDIGRALKMPYDAEPQDLPPPETARVLGWRDSKLVNLDAGEFVAPVNSDAPITMLGGAAYRSLVDKLREIGVSPRDAVRTAGTGGDDADAIQELLDYGNANGVPVYLDGNWRTSRALLIGAGPKPFDIRGRGFIVGIATAVQPGILVFEGDRFTLSGYLKVDGQRSAMHPVGWWVKGSPNFQFVELRGLSVDRCETGFRIGNKANPDAVISEIVVNGGSTYSCPRVGLIEGTETYVTLAGGMKPSDANSGDTAWDSKVKRGLTVIGSRVKVSGGELIQAGSAQPTDYLIDLQPLVKADGRLDWAEVELNNVYVETAGPLAIIQNPNTLGGAVSNKGMLRIVHCSGYHSQNNADFINVVAGAGFPGKIVEGGNNFRCPIPRTFQNINCHDNPCDVYPSLEGFGQNFKQWFNGITGGFTHGTPEDAGTGDYTPTVAAGAGALAAALASGHFRKVGGIVFLTLDIAITNNGTGDGAIIASLPIAPTNLAAFVLHGRANNISGKMLQGYISSTATVAIRNFDGSYPAATGERLRVSGWYEAAT